MGGPAVIFTQDEYTEIVRYAQERYITIVPEIDMPGHTNAALVGYPELSCSRRPPAPYTGTEVGWSTFCANKEETYALVDDVVREIAALTPGRYFHMGGDENPILTQGGVREVRRAHAGHRRVDTASTWWVGRRFLTRACTPTTLSQAWATDSVAAAALEVRRQGDSLARQTHLSRHEVRREHGARAHVGGTHRSA